MQRPKHENPKKNKAKQRGIKNTLAREGQKKKRKTAHASISSLAIGSRQ